jgi:DNA polymerase I-like protein with 3'-5' exonuclease and polymerase domains
MCTYPNLQQLPADEPTRSSFVAPEGNLMVSADFSAEESRLGADIYQDKEFIKEFLERSGDMHSMFAWAVFKKECQECGCTSVSDVKKKAPQWRKAVKAVEFAYMFGAAAHTISQAANCSEEQAQAYIDALDKEFTGVSSFAKKGSKFVREHGYILICPYTGHKMYWWDWKEWKERQASFTLEFWEDYRLHHKGTGDSVALMVREHFQAAGKYDRMARNSVTQGTGAIIMKEAITQLFRWILENNYFGVIDLCCCVHDEIVCDFPQELDFFPKKLEHIMESAAAEYCRTLPIPAEASVDTHWVH